MIAQTFTWWLVIQVIGAIALPIAFVLFRRLPGAGYAFAKPLGLLLTGYLFWLALTAEVLPNRPGSVVWVLLLLAAADFFLLRRIGGELRDALGSRLGVILAVEAVFFVGLFAAAHVRSYVPEIAGTEKPMDLMFLNAADGSRFYPPGDPWLAGFDVSYYYFGYVIQAVVSKLAAVSTPVAFNLGLVSTAALAATTAFGLGYDLASLLRRVTFRAALGVGLTAAVFVAVLGNLEGVLEFGAANGVLSDSAIERVNIANLETARESDSCLVPVVCIKYPDEASSFWWWWRATRISPDANSITEFPFFSFILGDLHPHVMSIPYVLTAFAFGLAQWRSGTSLSFDSWRERPLLLLLSAILVGGLGFLNTWDLPTFGFLIAALVLARNLAGRGWRPALSDTFGFLAPLAVLAFGLYAPFYLGFESQASGLAAVEGPATRPLHSALFWAPLMAVALPLPLALLARDASARPARRIAFAAALPSALLVAWALLLLVNSESLGDAVSDRGWNWLTALFFASALAASVLALWRSLESTEENVAALTPPLAAISAGLLLILGAELFYVRDLFGTRLNSVFKLYYQAWLLLAVGGAVGAYWFLSRINLPASPGVRWVRSATVGLAAVFVAGALLYPLGATLSRTSGLGSAQRTLDGTLFSRREAPDDYAAIDWLRERAGHGERLLEAVDNSYSSGGRVSARSGVSTVLGWPGHEVQWGRDGNLIAERRGDVERAYSTESLEEALSILQKYGVTYVFVGSVERDLYPLEGLQKFAGGLQEAFRSGDTVIFRAPPEVLTAGQP